MIDRDHLHRVTTTMIRYRLAAAGGHSRNGLTDPQAWRQLDRDRLADTLASHVPTGCAHLFDLQVTRQAIGAQRRAARRAAGRTPPPTPIRAFAGPPSPSGACAAIRAHIDRAYFEPEHLPDLAGRLITDLLHLLTAHAHPAGQILLGALDTVLAETTADPPLRATDGSLVSDPDQTPEGHHG